MLVNVPVAFFRSLLLSLCFGDGDCDILFAAAPVLLF